MYQKGAFHKGYIRYSPEFGFHFTVQQNERSQKIYFTVPLRNFKQNRTTLIGDDLLLTGHSTAISFLKPAMTSKNHPPLNFTFVRHLLCS